MLLAQLKSGTPLVRSASVLSTSRHNSFEYHVDLKASVPVCEAVRSFSSTLLASVIYHVSRLLVLVRSDCPLQSQSVGGHVVQRIHSSQSCILVLHRLRGPPSVLGINLLYDHYRIPLRRSS